LLGVIGVGLALWAPSSCSKARSESAPPAPAISAQPKAEAPASAAAAPAPRASDIEPASYQKPLGCSGKANQKQACRVLADFSKAERWSFDAPSGQGRWIGYAYRVEQGVEKRELMLVHVKRVPTSQVGSADLPIKVALGPLPEELSEHGQKLILAIGRGDVVSKKNRAQPYVETFTSQNDSGAAQTGGTSVRLVSQDNVHFRQEGRRRLLMVQPKTGPADAPGDGVYAEFWLAAW
jgi:hypothetical protein